jgi:hypothetical protein
MRRGVRRGKRVLELGAGAGLAGMMLAATGLAREVVLTDGNPTVVATLQLNVQRNAAAFKRTKLSAHMLHWAKYDGHLGYFDVIIAADWYALTPLHMPHSRPVEAARIRRLGDLMARRATTTPWEWCFTGLLSTHMTTDTLTGLQQARCANVLCALDAKRCGS